MTDMVFTLADSLERKGRAQRRGWKYMGNGSAEFTRQDVQRAKAWAEARSQRRLAGAFDMYLRTCSREGYPSAINTYDNKILTWGTGFAGRALQQLWRLLDQDVRSELAWMCPRRFSNAGIQVNESIRLDHEAIQSLIYVAENEPFRRSVFAANLKLFVKKTLGIDSLESLERARYLNADPNMVYFASRLVHWTPAIFSFPRDFYRSLHRVNRAL